jgi:hypothetical protein
VRAKYFCIQSIIRLRVSFIRNCAPVLWAHYILQLTECFHAFKVAVGL